MRSNRFRSPRLRPSGDRCSHLSMRSSLARTMIAFGNLVFPCCSRWRATVRPSVRASERPSVRAGVDCGRCGRKPDRPVEAMEGAVTRSGPSQADACSREPTPALSRGTGRMQASALSRKAAPTRDDASPRGTPRARGTPRRGNRSEAGRRSRKAPSDAGGRSVKRERSDVGPMLPQGQSVRYQSVLHHG